MTDLQRHIAALHETPHDKTVALSLADHFEEVTACSRYNALRKVAAIRKKHFSDVAFQKAAALFIPGGKSSQAVMRTLRGVALVGALEAGYDAQVVPGHTSPKFIDSKMAALLARRGIRGPTVLLSAYWLLKLHRPALHRHLICRRLGRICIVGGLKCRPSEKGIESTGIMMKFAGDEKLDAFSEDWYAQQQAKWTSRTPTS